MDFRIEKDTLGKAEVPADALWGSHTQRVINTYNFTMEYIPEEFLKNYVGLKRVYAEINESNGKLDSNKAEEIIKACDQLLELQGHEFMQHFTIDIIQSGGGTSTNMAVNEVIANLVNKSIGKDLGDYSFVHPNDHVNMSQSSNDTFPTVMQITTLYQLERLKTAAEKVVADLEELADRYQSLEGVARTHLQDATRFRYGELFKSYRVKIKDWINSRQQLESSLLELPAGATATGFTLNMDKELRIEIIKGLSAVLDRDFKTPESYSAMISFSDKFLNVSNFCKSGANLIVKICNDLRLLNSGPDTAINEVELPKVHAGSSIMPAKVNPSVPEAVEMACFRVIGHNSTVTVADLHSQLQLQAFMPIIAWSNYDSIELLDRALNTLSEKCLSGLELNEDQIKKNLKNSLVKKVEESEKHGYDEIADVIKNLRNS